MTRLIPIAAFALLSACSSEPEETAGGAELEAKGEILGGSISDDMLPLESVSSQSPQLADAPQLAARAQEEEAAEPEAQSAPEAPAVPASPAPAADAETTDS